MFCKGRYRVRTARGAADLEAAQRLRHHAFAPAGAVGGLDRDAFDAICTHVLIEDEADGALAGCFRMLALADGGGIERCYSAQFYDLSALKRFDRPMLELGRFCVAPGRRDPDILRSAWAAVTRQVDGTGVGMLFGCSSFSGTDAAIHAEAFALLGACHLAPRRWRPGVKAASVVRFEHDGARRCPPDRRRALRAMPPLLRSYLAMGGRVSDHAVIDRQLNTLHVFTGLETAAIPEARKRLLRAVAA